MGCSGFTNSPVMSTIDSLFRLPMNLIIGLLTLTSSTKKATCNVSDPCRNTINAPLPFVRIECTRPLKVAVFPTKLSSNSWIFFHAVSVIPVIGPSPRPRSSLQLSGSFNCWRSNSAANSAARAAFGLLFRFRRELFQRGLDKGWPFSSTFGT